MEETTGACTVCGGSHVKQTPFDHKVCSRCGGGGQYSWNAMHGSRCYGCSGTGYQLTKRGSAAVKRYSELMSKPVRDLQLGDRVRYDDPLTGRFWITVTEIEEREDGRYDWAGLRDTERGMPYGVRGAKGDDLVRIAQTGEQKVAAQRAALEYEKTLLRNGTPRKRPRTE